MWTEVANLEGPSRQQAIMAAGIREQAKPAKIDLLRDNTDFNFPKIHFLEHMPKHISGYGYLGQYLTEISEPTHKRQIKEGWRKCNHVDAMAQILKYSNNYQCMMKMKAEIELELDTTRPEPGQEKKYPRFCDAKVKKYRDVDDLSR